MNRIQKVFLHRALKKKNYQKVEEILNKHKSKLGWLFFENEFDNYALKDKKYLDLLISKIDLKPSGSILAEKIGRHLDYSYLKSVLSSVSDSDDKKTFCEAALRGASQGGRLEFIEKLLETQKDLLGDYEKTQVVERLIQNFKDKKQLSYGEEQTTDKAIPAIIRLLNDDLSISTSSGVREEWKDLPPKYLKRILSGVKPNLKLVSDLIAYVGTEDVLNYLLEKKVQLDFSRILYLARGKNDKMVEKALELDSNKKSVDFYLNVAANRYQSYDFSQSQKNLKDLIPHASQEGIKEAFETLTSRNYFQGSEEEIKKHVDEMSLILVSRLGKDTKIDLLSNSKQETPSQALLYDIYTDKNSAGKVLDSYESKPAYFMDMTYKNFTFLKQDVKNLSEEEVKIWGNVLGSFGIKDERSVGTLKDKFSGAENPLPYLNRLISLSDLKNKKVAKKAGSKLIDLLGNLENEVEIDLPRYLEISSELGDKFIANDHEDFNKLLGFSNFDKLLKKKLKQKGDSTKNLYLTYLKQQKSWEAVPDKIELTTNRETKEKIYLDVQKLSEKESTQTLVDKVNDTCYGVLEKILVPALAIMDKDGKYSDRISSVLDKIIPSFFQANYSESNIIKMLRQSERYHWYQHTIDKKMEDRLKDKNGKVVGWPAILDESNDIGDGYKITELKTTKGLKEQGKEMKQCVGGYTNRCLGNQNYHIFKVVDQKGKNCATVSINPQKNGFKYTETPKGYNNSSLNKSLRKKIDGFLGSLIINNKQETNVVQSKDEISINMQQLDAERSEYASKVNLYELTLGFNVIGKDGKKNWMDVINFSRQFLSGGIEQNLRKEKLNSPIQVLESLKRNDGKNLLQVLEEVTGMKYPKVSMKNAMLNLEIMFSRLL